MEKACSFATTTHATETAAAALVPVSEALARQLEQEYLDEYLARQMQHVITMDTQENQQQQQQDHQNYNNINNNDLVFSSKAAMSLLDNLPPDLDCQIYWSDDDYNDDDEQKSNKEDSKLPALVRGSAIFGAATQSGSSNTSTIGQLSYQQEQQQRQQHQYASFKHDTFSSPVVARQIVAPLTTAATATTATLSSRSSLQRALLLEYGGYGVNYATHTAAAATAVPKPSSLQRALRLEKQHAVSEVFAQQLQQQYDRELWEQQQSTLEAETLMHTSVTGRAWKFVEKVLALHDQYKQSSLQESDVIVPLATDDLVYLAERFIQKQASLRDQNRPTTVSLGFHFTNSTNLSQIRSNGLLTKQERQERNINSTFNGSVFGDGVYIASDVTVGATGRYGDIGIICACLNGKEKKGGRDFHPPSAADGDDDQQDSNALKLATGTRMFVLKTSSQCLGIFEFPRSLIKNHDNVNNIGVDLYWAALHRLVEELFNQNASTMFAI